MTRSGGFTLLEVLVALAVASMLLLGAVNYFGTTVPVVANTAVRAEEVRELQNVANVVADDVRKATQIWSSRASFDMDTTLAPGAPTASGQLVAMISPATTCASVANAYDFVAYYFAPRSSVVGRGEWISPEPDTANASTVVLMQYRACARETASGWELTNDVVRFVADYLGSGSFGYADDNRVDISMSGRRTLRGRTFTTPAVTLSAYARNAGV